jgi:hypothetical protein
MLGETFIIAVAPPPMAIVGWPSALGKKFFDWVLYVTLIILLAPFGL